MFGLYTDYRILSPYGNPTPQIVSNTTWTRYPDWDAKWLGDANSDNTEGGFKYGSSRIGLDWKAYLSCCYDYPYNRVDGKLPQKFSFDSYFTIPVARKVNSPPPFDAPSPPDNWGSLSGPFKCPNGGREGVEGLCFDDVKKLDDLLGFNPTAVPPQRGRRWSPRSGAVAVTAYDQDLQPIVYLMGGRARSYSKPPIAELQGGFLDNGAPGTLSARNEPSVPHEDVFLMSDVWFSRDLGEHWDFVRPGCWVDQFDMTKQPGDYEATRLGNPPGTYVPQSASCATDLDCISRELGDSMCDMGVCVCKYWSPRERFAGAVMVSNKNPVLFISGGIGYSQYTMGRSKRQASMRCGAFTCGSEFSLILQDVWSSTDYGTTWQQLNSVTQFNDDPRAFSKPVPSGFDARSDHAMVWSKPSFQWVILGGRGAAASDRTVDVLYGDLWTVKDGNDPVPWSSEVKPYNPMANRLPPTAGWSAVTTIPGAPVDMMYVFGGVFQSYNATPIPPTDDIQLVTDAASRALANLPQPGAASAPPPPSVSGVGWEFSNGLWTQPSNTLYFAYESDASALLAPFPATTGVFYQDFAIPSLPQYNYMYLGWPLTKPLPVLNVSATDLAALQTYAQSAGLAMNTVEDLASLTNADVTSLQPPPNGNGFVTIAKICSYWRSAQALVAPCQVQFRPPDGWNRMPPQFIPQPGAEPAGPVPQAESQRFEDDYYFANYASKKAEEEATSPPRGCPSAFDLVDAAGNVLTPTGDPVANGAPLVNYTLVDYVCRWVPLNRSSAGLAVMGGRLHSFGGRQGQNYYAADLWQRDDVLPVSAITHFPSNGGADTILDVNCSEPVCAFEARFTLGSVPDASKIVRNWTRITVPFDTLGVVLSVRTGGQYELGPIMLVEVRAVDPAGNRDNSTVYGRNAYAWAYQPPFPVLMVVLIILFFLLLLLLLLYLYRRYKRRKALEGGWEGGSRGDEGVGAVRTPPSHTHPPPPTPEYMRRRQQRRLREMERDMRSRKRVKKLKRLTRTVYQREKADNIYSEMDAFLRNDFRGLLRERDARGREHRADYVHDPRASPPLTTIDPAPAPVERDDVWNVGRRRTAKEALEFSQDALSSVPRSEVAKLSANFAVEVGNARRAQADLEMGRRGDVAADRMRVAVQVSSDTVAGQSAALTPARVTTGLVTRFAEVRARSTGRTVDAELGHSNVAAALVSAGGVTPADFEASMRARSVRFEGQPEGSAFPGGPSVRSAFPAASTLGGTGSATLGAAGSPGYFRGGAVAPTPSAPAAPTLRAGGERLAAAPTPSAPLAPRAPSMGLAGSLASAATPRAAPAPMARGSSAVPLPPRPPPGPPPASSNGKRPAP